MTVEEWSDRYGLQRGFNESESKQFFELAGLGLNLDTIDDKEYQEHLFNFIEYIIHKKDLDYVSKLDKIHLLVDANFCRQKFRKNVSPRT